MKKAQILSAIALAFALGVVVPVAGTYATVVYPVGTTDTQISEYNKGINNDVNAALEAYGNLEKVSEYTTLYNSIENDTNGLRELVNNVVKNTLAGYNNDTAFGTGVTKAIINEKIEDVEEVENGAVVTDASGALVGNLYAKDSDGNFYYIKSTSNLTQATLKDMSDLNRAGSLKDAYNAVKTLRDTANQNITILQNNYTTGKSDIVDTTISTLQDIVTASNAFLASIGTNFSNVIVSFATPDTYANYIKAVNEDTYDTMVNSAAWVDAAKDANTVNAVRYGIILNTATKLPKYNFVEQLADAKAEFDKIKATDQAVDYNKALDYIAAFNTAIKNYRDGKAPVTPTDPDTKPGEEGKDPTAPDTGILADAEGNASTTVAMVAGVATALTAAGAGVVAYRNARRSTRK